MARWCASANGQGALTKGYNPAYAGCGPLNVHRLGTEARQGQQRGWLCSSLRPHGAAPDRSAKRPQSPVASTRDTGAIHPWEPPTVGVGECAIVWRTRARGEKTRKQVPRRLGERPMAAGDRERSRRARREDGREARGHLSWLPSPSEAVLGSDSDGSQDRWAGRLGGAWARRLGAQGAGDDNDGDGTGEVPGEEARVEGVGGGGGEGADTIEGEGAAQDALLVRGEGRLTEGAGSEAGEGAAEGEGAEAGEEVQGHDEGEVHGRLLSIPIHEQGTRQGAASV